MYVYVDIFIYGYSVHIGSMERLNIYLDVGETALLNW